MTLLGRVRDMREGRVAFASDLEASLRIGDQAFEDFTRTADDYVALRGIEAPAAEADARLGPALAAPETVGEIDLRAARITSVIWATGYARDFGWVELPIFDDLGEPIHRRGVTAAPGVYMLGLPWLHKLKSSFLYGVGEDAEFLAERISREGR